MLARSIEVARKLWGQASVHSHIHLRQQSLAKSYALRCPRSSSQARPHLIFRVNLLSDGNADGTPCIADVEHRGIEVIDEGYDPYHSPLGCVVKRADGQFYYSTFQVPRDYVLKVWGARQLYRARTSANTRKRERPRRESNTPASG